MLGVVVVDASSNLHFTMLGVQAMLGMVAEAQYNVYYGYTAQELQEFIADTETGMVVEETVYDGADCHCRVPEMGFPSYSSSSSSSSSDAGTTTTTTTTTTTATTANTTTEYSSPSSSS